METKQAADALELYIQTSDKRTLDAFDFAFKHASRAVDFAARELAKHRREWHDDPEGDPEGHAEHTAPWQEQFDDEARAAVVVALFERCERIRQENILNAKTKRYRAKFTGRKVNADGIFYPIETEVTGADPKEAELNLYERYDHIRGLELTEL